MKIERRASQVVPLVEGPRVLHVGCAAHDPDPNDPTWLHGQLCKQFPEAVGLDLREDLIGKLEKLGFRNLYAANAETFELDRQFDTIVAGDMIEHLSNPGAFLRQAKKHLAPNGKIIITTPFAFSLGAFVYAFLKYPKTCWNVEHTCWFCVRTFEELSRRADLRIVHQDLIGSYTLDNPCFPYRAFVRGLGLFGWLLPKRLKCNTMLFVLTHSHESGNAPYRTDVLTSHN
jgi:2-polyprenyl-3-methyl-5-hydroxy-6-metoxy-1,4-benzoquinol methylase